MAVACKLSADLDQVVALEIVLPDSGRIEVNDTLRPGARALDGRGDTVTAPILWASLDTAIAVVVDSTTGVTFARAVGTGRLQARVGTLRSNPQNVFVLPPLDSVRAGGPQRDTVTLSAPDSLSDSLVVRVYAPPEGTLPLQGRRVAYAATVYPAAAATTTLVPRDTVKTDRDGRAAVRLRFTGGAAPDSVVVSATVRGFSPIDFVVEFRP